MSDQHDAKEPFTVWLTKVEHLDAKTAFRILTGDGDVFSSPAVLPPVIGQTPDEPSAFSDGSFTNPTLPQFGLASSEVWWPGGVTALSNLEFQYADSDPRPNGVAIMGFLGGL